jgi:MFS family permease
MTTYSATQRLGRTVGPLLTALVLGVWGPVSGFAIHGVLAGVACAVLVRATATGWDVEASGRSAASRPGGRPGRAGASPWAAAWAIGMGMVVLEALRSNRDLLVPLWGTEGLGLTPSRVALALGLSLALELVLFYPAGVTVDRVGWRPVALASLALMATGFAVMALASSPAFWVGLVLVGLGNGIGAGIIKTVGLVLAPTRGRADFLGRWTALAGLGSLGGPALVAVAALGGPDWVPLAATALLGGAGTVWLGLASRDRAQARSRRRYARPSSRPGALSPPPGPSG